MNGLDLKLDQIVVKTVLGGSCVTALSVKMRQPAVRMR